MCVRWDPPFWLRYRDLASIGAKMGRRRGAVDHLWRADETYITDVPVPRGWTNGASQSHGI